MHILIVTDQHPESLGGVQVSIRLQRQFLERLGHTVSIAAPKLHRPGYQVDELGDGAYIDLPSFPITRDREYGLSVPGARTDRALAAGLRGRPPVDVVHIQGDFWGAMIGLRAARGMSRARLRRGATRVPVVFTMHNHVDEGTRAVAGVLAPAAFQALRVWRLTALGRVRGSVAAHARGAWRYLAELAAEADAVLAPSQHFAAALEQHGVAEQMVVMPNGVDDDAVAEVRAQQREPRSRPRLVWLGRMSHEKRVLEFIEAISQSRIDADVVLHGAGLLLPRVRARIAALGLSDRVSIAGPVPHADALAAMREADALVQTSIRFETQGLTPFEAAAVGTPTVFCDPSIAADLAVEPSWVAQGTSVEALSEVLRRAVDALRRDPDSLRVDEQAGARLLQLTQTRAMVALYGRVLRATERDA